MSRIDHRKQLARKRRLAAKWRRSLPERVSIHFPDESIVSFWGRFKFKQATFEGLDYMLHATRPRPKLRHTKTRPRPLPPFPENPDAKVNYRRHRGRVRVSRPR